MFINEPADLKSLSFTIICENSLLNFVNNNNLHSLSNSGLVNGFLEAIVQKYH